MIYVRAALARACAIAMALAMSTAAAIAQGMPLPKPTLNANTTQQFPDQITGAITPATTRTYFNNMIASFQQAALVNAQTGTSYTVAQSDYGQLVTFNNAAAVTVSLPGPTTAGFGAFNVFFKNFGAGSVTITPTSGTIGGQANLVLGTNSAAWAISDGTNYQLFATIQTGAGTGSVTSVGLSMPGIFTVTGSPVTSSGTLTATAAGTSGGVPYFSSATALASSTALTANLPVIGGGAGAAPSSGARSGNTTTFATTSGALTSGNCIKIDASGNLVDNGATCGGGGGSPGAPSTSVQFNNSGTFGGSVNLTWVSTTLSIGSSGTATGQLGLINTSGGAVTLQVPSNPTSYNFNFPTAAGTSGAPLLSGGGSASPQSYSSILYPPSATTGGIPYFSSTTQITSSALLALNGVVYGGGAGASPASTAAALNGSLLVGNAGVAPQFAQMSQDCALSSSIAGQITCSKTAGVPFGPLATDTTPCPVAHGCTNGTTAASARVNTGLNIDECTTASDANYTILATDRCVFHSSLTAARTDTLPAANSVNPGQVFYLTDFAGAASAVKTITLQRAGTDTINGATSVLAISAQYGAALFWSDGSSRWTFLPTGAGGSGTVTSVSCNGLSITVSGTCPEPFAFENCSLAATVAANILTVAIKDNAGLDPTATSPCRIAFRHPAGGTGFWIIDSVTSALSINTVATGASLGSSNNTAFRFWVLAFDNASTAALGLYNASNATTCKPIDETQAQSSTAISGSATSIGVYYTTAALSQKSIKILGYIEYNSTGLVTAGTYASVPNFITSFGPGVKKPCENVQFAFTTTGQVFTSATAYSTVGTLTPSLTSAANLVRIEGAGGVVSAAGLNPGFVSLFRGTTAGTQLFSQAYANLASGAVGSSGAFVYIDKPNVAGSQQYTVGIRGDGTNSITLGRGDVNNNSDMMITEIQG